MLGVKDVGGAWRKAGKEMGRWYVAQCVHGRKLGLY
jgi:hypothetical protein